MAETFAHSVERTESRPPGAFLELPFAPGPGSAGIAVGVTGGLVEVIPGESFDDPPTMTQRAAVLVEVLAPGVAAPVASGTSRVFAPNGDLALVLGFTVPTPAEPGWRCRVRNVGDHAITIHARVTFTQTQPQMLQTRIPIRTLNNALHQFLDALGPQCVSTATRHSYRYPASSPISPRSRSRRGSSPSGTRSATSASCRCARKSPIGASDGVVRGQSHR